jgi:suppressor for copper-sensitivity B
MRILKIIFLGIFFAISIINFSLASSTNWQEAHEESAKVRILASFYEKDGQKKLILGAHFKIKDGWKIYGPDSSGFGLPAQFNFKNSQNISNNQIIWPEAKIAKEDIAGEQITYSYYTKEVILPIEVSLQNLNEKTLLNLEIDYGICKDICIPASAKFSLEITDEIDGDALAQIQKFYRQKLIEISSQNEQKNMLFYLVIFAIIGGAILNIMPCVLPVLSLKLVSIIKHSNSSRGKIRFAFFSTILGILFSFLFFAAIAIFLKETGDSLGWGLQFQNPYFLTFLIAILTLFTANLFGFFEISFNQILANFFNKKIIDGEVKKNIFLPNFLSGILAVLLATPCSAPFLGSAISFALTSTNLDILIIFIAIALGFALPYFILILSPKLISYLPKSGSWTQQLKKILALFLIGTILWLLYVLNDNIGFSGASLVALLTVLVFASFKIKSNFFKSLTISLLLIAIFMVPQDFQIKKKEIQKIDALWQNFNEENLEKYLQQDKVIIVDITASWCLTCKFNKARVLQDEDIVNLLKSGVVIGLRGDITKPNEKIMQYMKSKNRFAIPFNTVYGPLAKDGLLAGELLSKSELLELINKAKNND